MAVVVGTVSRRGLRIESHYKNQPNNAKLVCSHYFHFKSCLKQLYISNKMNTFVIKVGVAYTYQGVKNKI